MKSRLATHAIPITPALSLSGCSCNLPLPASLQTISRTFPLSLSATVEIQGDKNDGVADWRFNPQNKFGFSFLLRDECLQ